MFDAGYNLSGVVDGLFEVGVDVDHLGLPSIETLHRCWGLLELPIPGLIILPHRGYRSLGTGAVIGPCKRVDGVTADARAVHVSGGAPVV